MKRSKVYRKGKHIYVKSGTLTEVRRLPEGKEVQAEPDETCREIYANRFAFEGSPEGLRIHFGKEIFGTDTVKHQRSVRLDWDTARRFLKILQDSLEGPDGKKP